MSLLLISATFHSFKLARLLLVRVCLTFACARRLLMRMCTPYMCVRALFAHAHVDHRDKPRVCTPAKMFPHLKLKYFIISVYGPHSYF